MLTADNYAVHCLRLLRISSFKLKWLDLILTHLKLWFMSFMSTSNIMSRLWICLNLLLLSFLHLLLLSNTSTIVLVHQLCVCFWNELISIDSLYSFIVTLSVWLLCLSYPTLFCGEVSRWNITCGNRWIDYFDRLLFESQVCFLFRVWRLSKLILSRLVVICNIPLLFMAIFRLLWTHSRMMSFWIFLGPMVWYDRSLLWCVRLNNPVEWCLICDQSDSIFTSTPSTQISCIRCLRFIYDLKSIECLLTFYMWIKLNRNWSFVFLLSIDKRLVWVPEFIYFELGLVVIGFAIYVADILANMVC